MNKADVNKRKQMRPPSERLIAVIDIGSNSVRLVVYKGLKRTPEVVFNERVLCGLGAGIQTTGEMEKTAVNMALETLQRFSVLCRDMKVDEIDAVATAAVRDATNGPWFVKEAERRCRFGIRVLGGKEEATLSAYGVLSGFPGVNGIVGDLGGGSLELIHLKNGEIKKKKSLPIGPVRLLDGVERYTEDHVRIIHEALQSVKWLQKHRKIPFYMVGGAWRAFAHLNIVQTGWPLHVLHAYDMSGDAAYNFAKVIGKQGVESLKGIADIPFRRVLVMPLAARILQEILRLTTPSRVITSAYGIREGLMYKKINHAVRAQDPLLAVAQEIGQRHARFKKHGEVLSRWTAALFTKETPDKKRLREAVCHLSELSLKAHPDFKDQLAFSRSLVARYVGVTHKERAIISTALYISYGGGLEKPIVRPALRILNEKEVDYAVTLGLVTRLAQRLTGGTSRPLKKTRIYQARKKVILEVPVKDKVLIADAVAQRLNKLAEHLNLEADIRYS